MRPGDEFELSRELVLQAVATRHTVPSLGYLVWERRKKLKTEYQGMTGDQIRDIRLSGVEVSEERRMPLLGFTGDTSPEGLDANPGLLRSQSPDHRNVVRRPQPPQGKNSQARPHASRRFRRAPRPLSRTSSSSPPTSAPAITTSKSCTTSAKPSPTCSAAGCTYGCDWFTENQLVRECDEYERARDGVCILSHTRHHSTQFTLPARPTSTSPSAATAAATATSRSSPAAMT